MELEFPLTRRLDNSKYVVCVCMSEKEEERERERASVCVCLFVRLSRYKWWTMYKYNAMVPTTNILIPVPDKMQSSSFCVLLMRYYAAADNTCHPYTILCALFAERNMSRTYMHRSTQDAIELWIVKPCKFYYRWSTAELLVCSTRLRFVFMVCIAWQLLKMLSVSIHLLYAFGSKVAFLSLQVSFAVFAIFVQYELFKCINIRMLTARVPVAR